METSLGRNAKCVLQRTLRVFVTAAQKQSQLQRVGRRRAFLVVVEIDEHVASLFFPRFDAFRPCDKRLLAIVAFVAALWSMTSDIHEVGSPAPRRRGVVVIGDAECDIAL